VSTITAPYQIRNSCHLKWLSGYISNDQTTSSTHVDRLPFNLSPHLLNRGKSFRNLSSARTNLILNLANLNSQPRQHLFAISDTLWANLFSTTANLVLKWKRNLQHITSRSHPNYWFTFPPKEKLEIYQSENFARNTDHIWATSETSSRTWAQLCRCRKSNRLHLWLPPATIVNRFGRAMKQVGWCL